jgi:hypothetical protein
MRRSFQVTAARHAVSATPAHGPSVLSRVPCSLEDAVPPAPLIHVAPDGSRSGPLALQPVAWAAGVDPGPIAQSGESRPNPGPGWSRPPCPGCSRDCRGHRAQRDGCHARCRAAYTAYSVRLLPAPAPPSAPLLMRSPSSPLAVPLDPAAAPLDHAAVPPDPGAPPGSDCPRGLAGCSIAAKRAF